MRIIVAVIAITSVVARVGEPTPRPQEEFRTSPALSRRLRERRNVIHATSLEELERLERAAAASGIVQQ